MPGILYLLLLLYVDADYAAKVKRWRSEPLNNPRCSIKEKARGIGECHKHMRTYFFEEDHCHQMLVMGCSLEGKNRHLTQRHCELTCVKQIKSRNQDEVLH
ncbi:uncharacterized protein LOC115632201 [Scaptodrosophila lebanonensis]|uniref:Uncharacterized protein LOC115632201 n=1 Tax=Drosophila lebanonensis TaxID=7225 RepID=A0A6J2UAR3_DROLE|nr:uncharacterized protein LOC115632201 [Scaptodrosophila lebanonensis]